MTATACQEKEPLWELAPPGTETQAMVSMGPEYEYMVFFKFKNGTLVKQKVCDWDIAFASGSSERHITLNGGNAVQVYNTCDTAIGKVFSEPDPEDWQWDNPNGDPDSTAIGQWYNKFNGSSLRQTYLIDCGPGNPGPYTKMVILSCDSVSYRIRLAGGRVGSPREFTIPKNPKSNYTYFSIRDLKVVSIEPPSTDWDIVFTKYRFVYYDMVPITPYYVCGTLLNRNKCKVVECRNRSFEAMDKATAATLNFTRKADEIGYDWKAFDLNALRYTVRKNQFFLIEDEEGFIYKLRFLDFYDEKGQKGFPSFLYQRL